MDSRSDTLAMQLATSLAARGVRHAFGMPGGVLLGLLEAFRQVGIDFVLVRHEGSAGFMADVCAQLTGAPGVCVGTLGPGLTNLVSPIAGAHLERSPVLAISGQIGTALLGTYTHQILDHVALLAPVTRHAALLTADSPCRQLDQALDALSGDLPGPVLVDVPAELWAVPIPPLAPPPIPVMRLPDAAQVSAGAALLSQAKRPVMAVGILGLNDSVARAVTAMATALSVPVITTYRAKGAISELHPLSAGAFGLSPVVDECQQELLSTADLILTVGLDPVELRPQWLPGWPADLPMIAISSSPDIPHPVTVAIDGDIPGAIGALQTATGPVASLWTEAEIQGHRSRWAAPFDDGPDGPAATISAIQAGMGPDALCAMDVGAHRITASHTWACTAPFQQVQSNGFSSMGTGLPGAIAAKLCHPDRPVVALTGDMGLWMALGELGVVQEREMDLVVVYLADRSLSLIALKQERTQLPCHGVSFENPDVVALAQAFGGTGRRVQGAVAVEAAVAEAVAAGGLQIIEAVIDPAAYREQM
jgi:acetolactate synthase I/II/III large subunit